MGVASLSGRIGSIWIVALAAIVLSSGIGVASLVAFLRVSSDLDRAIARLESAVLAVDDELSVTESALGSRLQDLEAQVPELAATLVAADEALGSDLATGLAAFTAQLRDRAVELASALDSLEADLTDRVDAQSRELTDRTDLLARRDESILDDLAAAQAQANAIRAELAEVDDVLFGKVDDQTLALTQVADRLNGTESELRDLESSAAQLGTRVDRTLLDVSALYEAAKASAVEILDGAAVSGSGFTVGANREFVVTAWHVVEEIGASNLKVRTLGGTVMAATVVQKTITQDVAVLRVDGMLSDTLPARVGTTSHLRIGEPIWVLGSPAGLKSSVSVGYVGGLDRDRTDFPSDFLDGFFCETCTNMLQLDATVVGGNSGGPVFDRNGAVVGIISWGFVSSELNFAVSSVHIAALVAAAGVT